MSEFNQYRPQSNFGMPMVVKNLIIINVLFFLATQFAGPQLDMYKIFAGHFPTAPDFRIWQPITSMFMHANLSHIFFNMFALFMFGSKLENYWGPKRFLTFYMICGIGADIVYYTVFYFRTLQPYEAELRATLLPFDSVWEHFLNYGTISLGASGAVFGLLLAFGMLFPNTELMMLFFPVPIKAKYFVVGYGLIELFQGINNNPNDNVAHFAHLGGMLFGFIMIKYWNKTMRNRFY